MSKFTPRVASETFGTSIMKTDEVVLFVKAALENGSDIETAYQDMQMIDSMLHMKQLYYATIHANRYTRSGNVKKNNTLHDQYSLMLDGIIKNQENE